MVSIVLLSGLFIGAMAAGLVLADTIRRNLPNRARYLWAGGVGVVSVGGFLAVYSFDNTLYQLYLTASASPLIAPLPREVAVAFLLIPLTGSSLAVLAYGFGSRYGPLKSA